MHIQKETSKDYFKALFSQNLIFTFQSLALIVVAGVLRYLDVDLNYPESTVKVLNYAVPLLSIGIIAFQIFLSTKRLEETKKEIQLITKMTEYRPINVFRTALITSASFLCAIGYLITNNLFHIALYVVVMAYFLYLFPTKRRVIKDLELNSTEQYKLENSDEIIAEITNKYEEDEKLNFYK